MTATAKMTKTLRLTSRAKSPKRAAKKIQAAPAPNLKEMLAASIELVTAAAPVAAGLDSDAGTPAEQIGELVRPRVKPVRGKAKSKAKMAKSAPMSVVLDREPGRGWFHVVIDGERAGAVFKTTRMGVAFWAAEPPDRGLRSEGATRTAAVDAFVQAYTSRAA
jgi:hypothetical protein